MAQAQSEENIYQLYAPEFSLSVRLLKMVASEAAKSEPSEAYPLEYVAAMAATENKAEGHFQQPLQCLYFHG